MTSQQQTPFGLVPGRPAPTYGFGVGSGPVSPSGPLQQSPQQQPQPQYRTSIGESAVFTRDLEDPNSFLQSITADGRFHRMSFDELRLFDMYTWQNQQAQQQAQQQARQQAQQQQMMMARTPPPAFGGQVHFTAPPINFGTLSSLQMQPPPSHPAPHPQDQGQQQHFQMQTPMGPPPTPDEIMDLPDIPSMSEPMAIPPVADGGSAGMQGTTVQSTPPMGPLVKQTVGGGSPAGYVPKIRPRGTFTAPTSPGSPSSPYSRAQTVSMPPPPVLLSPPHMSGGQGNGDTSAPPELLLSPEMSSDVQRQYSPVIDSPPFTPSPVTTPSMTATGAVPITPTNPVTPATPPMVAMSPLKLSSSTSSAQADMGNPLRLRMMQAAGPVGGNANAPRISTKNYYTEPPMHQLATMTDTSLSRIRDLKIGCRGLGSVTWPGLTDVRNLELDLLVRFSPHEVVVYPNGADKPPTGTGLNKEAVVSLLDCYPKCFLQSGQTPSAAAANDPNTMKKYKARLERVTREYGAEWISYNEDTGEWKFRVEHFSRWGLPPGFGDDVDEAEADASDVRPMKLEETAVPVAISSVMIATSVRPVGPQQDDQPSAAGEQAEHAARSLGVTPPKKKRIVARPVQDAQSTTIAPTTPDVDATLRTSCIMADPSFQEHSVRVPDSRAVTPLRAVEAPMVMEVQERPNVPVGVLTPLMDSGTFVQASRKLAPTADAMPFHLGRSFRVGWGAGGRLIRPTSLSLPTVRLSVTRAPLSVDSATEKCLEFHARDSRPDGDSADAGAPRCCIADASSLLKRLAQSSIDSTRQRLWNLVEILFADSVSHESRYVLLSRWTRNALEPEIEKASSEMERQRDFLAAAFLRLSGGQFVRAAQLAMQAKHPRLAMLIASAARQDAVVRQSLAMSDCWGNGDVKAILFLLAGKVTDQAVFGRLTSKLACLGAHFWFGGQPDLVAAIKSFGLAIKEGRVPESAKVSPVANDGLSELLLFFANSFTGDAAVQILLNPVVHGLDNSDYSLSWFLMTLLQALKNVAIPARVASLVATSFASQLESSPDKWPWAVYVLLSKPCGSPDHFAVALEVMSRHRPSDSYFRSIEQQFHIPPWPRHQLLAWKAKHELQFSDEARHLACIGKCPDSLLLEHVVPSAVLGNTSESLGDLRLLLQQVGRTGQSPDVTRSPGMGAEPVFLMLLDYLSLTEEGSMSKMGRPDIEVKLQRVCRLLTKWQSQVSASASEGRVAMTQIACLDAMSCKTAEILLGFLEHPGAGNLSSPAAEIPGMIMSLPLARNNKDAFASRILLLLPV